MDEQPVRRGRDVLQKPRPRTRQRQPDFCDIFLDTYRGSSKRHTEEDRACSVEQADDSNLEASEPHTAVSSADLMGAGLGAAIGKVTPKTYGV
jgi:hypothetical protein